MFFQEIYFQQKKNYSLIFFEMKNFSIKFFLSQTRRKLKFLYQKDNFKIFEKTKWMSEGKKYEIKLRPFSKLSVQICIVLN